MTLVYDKESSVLRRLIKVTFGMIEATAIRVLLG